MRLGNRLSKLEREAQTLPRNDQFTTIEAIPVAHAGGRSPGLYRAGSPGSTAGILVYEPDEGEPVLPKAAWFTMAFSSYASRIRSRD
jgi:hypothetical protein